MWWYPALKWLDLLYLAWCSFTRLVLAGEAHFQLFMLSMFIDFGANFVQKAAIFLRVFVFGYKNMKVVLTRVYFEISLTAPPHDEILNPPEFSPTQVCPLFTINSFSLKKSNYEQFSCDNLCRNSHRHPHPHFLPPNCVLTIKVWWNDKLLHLSTKDVIFSLEKLSSHSRPIFFNHGIFLISWTKMNTHSIHTKYPPTPSRLIHM